MKITKQIREKAKTVHDHTHDEEIKIYMREIIDLTLTLDGNINSAEDDINHAIKHLKLEY